MLKGKKKKYLFRTSNELGSQTCVRLSSSSHDRSFAWVSEAIEVLRGTSTITGPYAQTVLHKTRAERREHPKPHLFAKYGLSTRGSRSVLFCPISCELVPRTAEVAQWFEFYILRLKNVSSTALWQLLENVEDFVHLRYHRSTF